MWVSNVLASAVLGTLRIEKVVKSYLKEKNAVKYYNTAVLHMLSVAESTSR